MTYDNSSSKLKGMKKVNKIDKPPTNTKMNMRTELTQMTLQARASINCGAYSF
jgi:hypothetical protein